jgi:hypothetical protein
MILLISASQVTNITDVSPQHPAQLYISDSLANFQKVLNDKMAAKSMFLVRGLFDSL